MTGTALLGGVAHARTARSGEIGLVLAPSNLGLRPNEDGSAPGAWRAPHALMAAGLADAIGSADVVEMARPVYRTEAEPGTQTRNGNTLRAFSLELSTRVRNVIRQGRLPVVIGGDCGILMGCMHGLRLAGGKGLLHIDGHSDFTNPKGRDATRSLHSAAGMDLALTSGRGDPLLTRWPKIEGPLADDADIVQLGERNADDPDFMRSYGDIVGTAITRLTIQHVLGEGIDAAAREVVARLETRGLDKIWVHVDLDVLDQTVMPAVDSPGSPGLDYAQLSRLVSTVKASGRIAGIDFAIYDPDRDADARYAHPLVRCIADAVRGPA